MKSMSDDIITKKQLDDIASLAKSDVDQLRVDLERAHVRLSIAVAFNIALTIATLILASIAFVHH